MLAGILLVGIAATAGALALSEDVRRGISTYSSTAGAVYSITNECPNKVVALIRYPNGSLADGSLVATGGNGGNILLNSTAVTGPIALGATRPLAVAGNFLFAINAGSNTISLFCIDPSNPIKLTLVGKPVDTGGEFPVTLAVAPNRRIVCVAHSGRKDGVTCASYSSNGLTAFDTPRPFGLGQTTPPTIYPLFTGKTFEYASQLFFNNDESGLYALINFNSTDGGRILSYPVTNQTLPGSPLGCSVSGIPFDKPAPFPAIYRAAMLPLPGDRAAIAAGADGVVTVDLNVHTGAVKVVNNYQITKNETATSVVYASGCRTVFSACYTEMGLIEHVPQTGAKGRFWLSELNSNPPFPVSAGSFASYYDVVAVGDLLYALTATSLPWTTRGIAVINVSGTEIVEQPFFQCSTLTRNSVGLAVYIAPGS